MSYLSDRANAAKKTISNAAPTIINPSKAISDPVTDTISGAIDRTGNSIIANSGNHGEASKLIKQTGQGTKDLATVQNGVMKGDSGSAWAGIKAGMADGPSPGPTLNPGDATKGGAGNGAPGSGPQYSPIKVGPDPTRPAFVSQNNPDGTIKKQLSAASAYAPAHPGQSSASAANIGTAGKALTARATAAGPSPWLKLQLQQQGIEERNAQGNATAANVGATAGARTALASHGGLSSGAMERVQKSGANDLALQRQTIANQGQQSRLGLNIADDNTKTGLLSNAAGLEQGLSQFNAGQTNQNNQFNAGQATGVGEFNAGQGNQAKQFDVSNALGDTQAGRNADLAYYQELMRKNAAGVTANAIGSAGGANAGGGGKSLGG